MSTQTKRREQGEDAVRLRPETEQRVMELLKRYPVAEAALIPVLHLVQDELDWLPVAALDRVAELLSLPRVRVYGVVSFYSMFRREKAGRFRLEICTNLSCSLMGATHLSEHLCQKLGLRPGQTTADGLFTVEEVECLGACGCAPVMLVNGEFHENLDPDKLDALLDALRVEAKEGAHHG